VEQAEAWQETERASLVAAVVFAADHGHPEHSWQLAESLHGYLSRHGYVEDWLRTHQVALGAALAAGDRAGEAVTRTYLGSCYMFLDRGEDALDNLYRALELHRQAGNRNLETGALGFLGYVCGRAGRFAEALEYTRLAIGYASGRDVQREALLREHAGKLLTVLGRFDEAFDNYERAIVLYREVGLPSDVQQLAEICVGDVYRNMGRLDEARELLERLVADAADHGPVPNEANARHRLGNTYWALGRLDDALAQLTEALGLARTVGVFFTESEVLVDLGVVHRDAGRLEEALDMVGEALTLAVATKERYQQARALDALAGLHDRAGHPDLAEDHWRRAYDLFTELGTPEADRIRPRITALVSAL